MDTNDVIQLAFDADDRYLESNTVADVMHYAAIRKGWQSKREAPAPTKGRKGRVDLLISHEGYTVAVEVDDRAIKGKSVEKLLSLDVDARVCVIARGDMDDIPNGIDAVVSIRERGCMMQGAYTMTWD